MAHTVYRRFQTHVRTAVRLDKGDHLDVGYWNGLSVGVEESFGRDAVKGCEDDDSLSPDFMTCGPTLRFLPINFEVRHPLAF